MGKRQNNLCDKLTHVMAEFISQCNCISSIVNFKIVFYWKWNVFWVQIVIFVRVWSLNVTFEINKRMPFTPLETSRYYYPIFMSKRASRKDIWEMRTTVCQEMIEQGEFRD